MSLLNLYGVPLSQPFRAVAWTMLQRKVPFEIQLTVPGMTTKIGSLNESYLDKTRSRSGNVPLLEDASFTLEESPAILSYLCETHGWQTDLYGMPGSEKKAIIDSYMHWHHTGTRNIAYLIRPYIRPELNVTVTDEEREAAEKALKALDRGWLHQSNSNNDFIAGGSKPSIADILAYEEVVQVTMTNVLTDLGRYPNVEAWTKRMSKLPFHEEAHVALKTLGDLSVPSETPMMKRLGAATKEGIKAFKLVQEDF